MCVWVCVCVCGCVVHHYRQQLQFKIQSYPHTHHPHTHTHTPTQLSDYGLVQFMPLDINDEDNIGNILLYVDSAIQYGEDLEVHVPKVINCGHMYTNRKCSSLPECFSTCTQGVYNYHCFAFLYVHALSEAIALY